MHNSLFIALLLLVFHAPAQDLNGIWKGKLLQDPGGCYSEYNIELQINYTASANSLNGRAFDYYDIARYVKFDFSGRYNTNSKRMVIIENTLMDSKIPMMCVPCIKTYDLTWTKVGNEEILTGECKAREYGNNNVCPSYKVSLKRAAKSDFAVDIEQSPELTALQETMALKPREKKIVETLRVDTSLIRLDLYDDAEIDNDTVTVLLNNKLLLYKKMLTAKPLTMYVNAFPGTDYELVMYADNLGSIPPNTALLVVTAGTKKYELYLSSSLQKSAAVRFRYDKKE
ncbi:MAG TPA: hypothetical protein VGM41_01090 [Chitinophagaceae bacterium]|jgi:hypothetical protein